MTIEYSTPSSPSQWAEDYLNWIGAPATGPNDPRVQFLSQWEQEEGNAPGESSTYSYEQNPLSTGQPEPGSKPFNSSGIQGYGTGVTGLEAGLQGTETTMLQGFDAPIFKALQDPSSTETDLVNALANSNWSGYGAGSATEANYANTVGTEANPGGSTYGGAGPSSSGGAGATSSGTSGPVGVGFLHSLQGVLNPDLAPSLSANVGKDVTNIVFLPATDAGKVALMILARFTVVMIGTGMILGGAALLFAGARSVFVRNVVSPAERIERVLTRPEQVRQSRARLTLEQQREERRQAERAERQQANAGQ